MASHFLTFLLSYWLLLLSPLLVPPLPSEVLKLERPRVKPCSSYHFSQHLPPQRSYMVSDLNPIYMPTTFILLSPKLHISISSRLFYNTCVFGYAYKYLQHFQNWTWPFPLQLKAPLPLQFQLLSFSGTLYLINQPWLLTSRVYPEYNLFHQLCLRHHRPLPNYYKSLLTGLPAPASTPYSLCSTKKQDDPLKT